MLLARVALLASLSCAALGCADDDDDLGNGGSLEGTVRDGQTGKGIKGARVVFLADTGETAKDDTDASGRFSFVVRAQSPLGRLTVSKGGYRTRVVSTFGDGASRLSIDLLSE